MLFGLFFKLIIYLLVLDVFDALYLTHILAGPVLALTLAAVLGSWWADDLRPRIPNYRRLWDVLTGIFLVYAVLDLFFLAESLIAALIHLLLFLLAYKLYNARHHRDLMEIVVLTFLLLVAAATLTVSFGFLLVFCLYMILGIWALLCLHLKRETEAAYPERSRELLARSRMVAPAYLLNSVIVALGSLVLTLAIFLVIPRVGLSYLPLRAQIGTLSTGFTDQVDLGAYGTIQQDPTIVMRVSFLEGPSHPDQLPNLRWRGLAFDRFDGRTWSLSDPRTLPARQVRENSFVVSPYRAGLPIVPYEVFLEPIGTSVLFGLPRIVSIQGRLAGLGVDAGDGITLPGPPSTRLHYLAVSQPESFRTAMLDRVFARDDYPPEIRETYLEVPPLSPRLRDLARQLAAGAETPYRVARRVEAYLSENLRYTLDLRPGSGEDPLDDFLFVRRAGNCEYFAASMAILLRAVGIPVRVVNGFQRGEWNEVGQYFAIRQRDAHSWVEVYFPGAGWVTFDPSPRAAFEARLFGESSWAGKYFDALRMRWNRYVIDYSLSDQAVFAMNLGRRSAAFRRGLGATWDAWSFRMSLRLRRLWREYGSGLAFLLALVAAAGTILLRRAGDRGVAGAWFLRTRLRQSGVPFYERTLRLLRRRGHSKPPAATAREFATGLPDRRELKAPVEELTALYERVRFGGERLTAAEERRVAALLQELARAR